MKDDQPQTDLATRLNKPIIAWSRGALGLALLVLLVAYLVTIIIVGIPPERRVSVADLAVVVVGAVAIILLFWPKLVEHLEWVEVATVKFQLRDLRDKQQTQKKELDDLRFVLSLTVTDGERAHLQNLEAGKAANYRGSTMLQTELRRLRALGLIKSRRPVGDIPRGPFDLADYAELTPRGKEYLKWMQQSDQAPVPN
jgi:hypothetical protein